MVGGGGGKGRVLEGGCVFLFFVAWVCLGWRLCCVCVCIVCRYDDFVVSWCDIYNIECKVRGEGGEPSR